MSCQREWSAPTCDGGADAAPVTATAPGSARESKTTVPWRSTTVILSSTRLFSMP
jgi:hypothetical protein